MHAKSTILTKSRAHYTLPLRQTGQSEREFFQIEPEQVIPILRLLHSEDATKEVAEQMGNIDEESREAADRFRNRRPNLDFTEMGIPIGATLKSTKTD